MTRAFYQWAGGTEADHEALARLSAAMPEQMGPRVASFRGGLTAGAWGRALALMLAVYVALVPLDILAGQGSPDPVRWLAMCAVFTACYLPLLLVVLFLARRHHQDVHVHGLVVRGAWGAAEAIPWASIDPGRIFIATTVRAMTRMPLALYRQQAVLPPGVIINGWTQRPQGRHAVFEAFSAGYRYQPQPGASPFGWWQLGVTDPARFLASIEQAMLADGYRVAGLTPFVLSRQVSGTDLRRDPAMQAERALTDPVIGLPQR